VLRTVLANEVNVQNDFSKIVGENQRSLAAELASGFDYIVCGAGTSGVSWRRGLRPIRR
jgi:hypothetical protein